jgi:CRISPR/Cas system CSM-associated protein Csm3 (group 7 of RAMP superfamily)
VSNIKGKILLIGQIECLSPFHIGSGKGKYSDLDILCDMDRKPFIPATSFVGILRHTCQRYFKDSPLFEDFWGYTKDKNGQQSGICCSELTYIGKEDESPEVVIRDGIEICGEKGLVKQRGKFDFELVEREGRFRLCMEFTYRENNETFVRQTVRTIYQLLAEERIRIGAKTNNGLGQIRLLQEQTHIYLYDFTKKMDLFHWLTQNFSQQNTISPELLAEPVHLGADRVFTIIATLKIKNSLIIRSYSHQPEMPHTTQLRSKNDCVIPGSSLKGAIRARAERIVNTLELKKEIITKLFGDVDEGKSKNAQRGRVRIKEIILPDREFQVELQSRIKIDRFTAGVIEGGLFDSMPVFTSAESSSVTIQIDITEYKEYEAGLLLLVLKDLWSGDLAIGGEKNIGRGVFQGVKAEIVWDNEKVIIGKEITELSEQDKERLEALVKALMGECD